MSVLDDGRLLAASALAVLLGTKAVHGSRGVVRRTYKEEGKPPPKDFDTSHLTGKAKRVAEVIVEFLRKDLGKEPYSGGSRVFYSPKEWKDRGEQYSTNSVLVILHEGNDLARYCSYDVGDYKAIERMNQILEPLGFYIEQGTSWQSAVYEN